MGTEYATMLISYDPFDQIQFFYLKYYFMWLKPPKKLLKGLFKCLSMLIV